MTDGWKVFWGIAGIGTIAGIAYYKAINNLQFAPSGVQLSPDGSALQLIIKVTNPSAFGFPFPPATFTVTDSNGNALGTGYTYSWQYIAGHSTTEIYVDVNPQVGNLFTALMQAIQNRALPAININAIVHPGPFSIPINTSVSISGPGAQPFMLEAYL